jgi:hypothetical protein
MKRNVKSGSYLLLLSVVFTLTPVTFIAAQALVMSYTTTSTLQVGTIVQMQNSKKNIVTAQTQTNETKMFGVVISPNDSPVSLSTSTSSSQAYVASSGNYSVLVDNQNGPIDTGDYITASSLNGFGMKASSSDSTTLGRALTSFNGSSDSIGQTTLKESGGRTVNVSLGRIIVDISIGPNPVQQNILVPGFLKSVAQSVSAKPVSAIRIYSGLLVLLVAMIVAGGMLYAGIRSSVIAIGRNPLSQRSITRSLIQITFTSLIVFIIGLIAVYLLLKL